MSLFETDDISQNPPERPVRSVFTICASHGRQTFETHLKR
jgi:hypothetical protein